MGNGLVNTRDQKFVLYEQIGIESLFVAGRYEDYTVEDVNLLLGEAEKMAVNEIQPTYSLGDQQGCTFTDGQVSAPPCFHEPYKKFCEAGWNCATRDPDVGGQGMPLTVFSACAELFNSANFAFVMYPGLTWGAAGLIEKYGTEEQMRKYMDKMYSGQWGGTMCLTEAGAGSDVGALKTRARRLADGTYQITGSKCFISSGDHDLTENIVHAVLARVEGDPPGTDGISLFIVPKVKVNDDGSLGAANDVITGNIEHKLGIKGSATCTLNFGENESCIGELLGEQRTGMRIMFNMMNEARLEVGMQGLGHATAAYEQSLQYARDRIQGRPIWDFANPAAQGVAIIEHPDVRRMLLWMKAYVEGIRAMNYYVAYCLDRAEIAATIEQQEYWQGFAELLTPVCKAFSSDKAMEICSLAIDVYGGYGYCSEYPVEQYLRDAKIACLYEGTNGIQALDLVGRKLAQNKGKNIRNLLQEIGKTAAQVQQVDALSTYGGLLGKALQAVGGLTESFAGWAEGAGLIVPILNARPYLNILGDLVVGWQLLQGAAIAAGKLEAIYRGQDVAGNKAGQRALARTDSEVAFYQGKMAAARYFAVHILHSIKSRCQSIAMQEKVAVEMLDSSFGG
ncbi:MAG: acyl-CoA dehydrogenase [Deltaproteobacteria bacterium]|nr:acyl-CoA dehydrogenase [Candidatus Anaeroferrophillus wilburensis]MBN2888747.1 acyl-CoA dehydrogenase [Deltaproteobacteria bacterium]